MNNTKRIDDQAILERERGPFPVKPGDWIAQRENAASVAVVKSVYWSSLLDTAAEIMVDVIIYDILGKKVGRESPACGGPRTFEPCLPWADWCRIEKPRFPIKPKWVPNENGSVTLMRHHGANSLPDRSWVEPQRRTAMPKRLMAAPALLPNNGGTPADGRVPSRRDARAQPRGDDQHSDQDRPGQC